MACKRNGGIRTPKKEIKERGRERKRQTRRLSTKQKCNVIFRSFVGVSSKG